MAKALLVLLALCWASPLFAEDSFTSPDKRYHVALQKQSHPTRLYDQTQVLQVRENGRPIMRIPMDGYIQAVYFKEDGCIAINSRNASSGDYVWVLDAAHRKIVKRPYQHLKQDTRSLEAADRRFKNEELFRQWIFARGWTSQGLLRVREDDLYSNVTEYLRIDFLYSIKGDQLVLKSQKASVLKRE